MKSTDKTYGQEKIPVKYIFLILLFGIALLFFPYMFTSWKSFLSLSYDSPGEIGDIISGITMPFISFAGIILTFLAFWIQYKANLELRRDIEIERFNNRFYELLKLHKENVSEMDLGGVHKGRDVFVALHEELKYTYWIIENELNEMNNAKEKRQPEFVFDIAYRVFYEGLDTVSFDRLKVYLEKICSSEELNRVITKLTGESKRIGKEATSPNIPNLGSARVKFDKVQFRFQHPLFKGQISRLGHYYRHLYLIISYIDSSRNKVSDEVKYEYVKTVRGQLSVYEQAMLFYNALSESGKPWLKKENPLLTKYKMIKNIRPGLTDFGPDPWDRFKKEIEEFAKVNKRFFEYQKYD